MNSITFGEGAGAKNTWTDWGLALLSQPDLPTPPLKTKLLESEGMDGEIDLTTAITGYPVFGNRKGRFKFAADLRFPEWQTKLQDIKTFLHGQYMRMRLSDDPGWYWEGRFTVEDPQARPNGGTLAIAYSVGPYKWAMTATDEPWLWDPFSFVDGVIGNGTFAASFSASASVSTTPLELAYTAQQTGIAFFFPSFTVTGDNDVTLEIKAGDETRATITLAHGATASVPRLALTEGRWLYRLEEVQVFVSTASCTATLALAASVSYQGADVFSHIEVGTTAVPLAFSAMETGQAPLQVEFAATGTLTITAVTSGASAISVTQTITNSTATVDGLVMCRGGWLLQGRPATVSAATSSGTATLALKFRQGRL